MQANKFSSLFQGAIREWSETVKLAELQHQDGGRYSVVGLGKQLEEIELRYIQSKEEVIWRELHWAIFTVIHSLAKSLLEIKPSSIRAEEVQRIFKQRLQKAIASNDSGWNADDFVLAQEYLQDGDV
ncbi:MAG: hypothetical protein C0439_19755 [Pseudomonas sp.]|nr:hypothetical protein [Pseudomonas sp.]